MTYKYLQGIDYGPRAGTLGLSFHMSEGYDGLPQYLAKRPGETRAQWADRVNGVSCHVAILSTGEVWQMLDWRSACGNLNPSDRSGEYGYYGASHLKAVLGSHWPDPNAWTLSAELAGFRTVGPTDAQVRSAVQWGREMKALFPSIRGAIGHHDQSPKPCPGLTPNMRRIFDGVGGHGLWTPDTSTEEPVFDFTWIKDQPDSGPGTVTVAGDGHAVILANGALFYLADGSQKHSYGLLRFKDGNWAGQEAYMVGDDCGFLLKRAATYVPDPNPADAVAAELERAADRAHDAVLEVA